MRTKNFLEHFIQYIFIGVFTLIFIGNFFVTADFYLLNDLKIIPELNARVVYFNNYWWILFVLLYFFSLILIKKTSAEKLFFFFSIIYLFLALKFMFSSVNLTCIDSQTSLVLSNALLEKDYQTFLTFDNKYIQLFPYQLGLVLYNSLFLKMFNNSNFIVKVINIFYILFTNYYLYKIVNKIFKNNNINKLTVMLSFSFIPLFFYFSFIYGNIPGLCCITISFYHFICLYKDEKPTKHSTLMIIFSVLACILKQNYMIASIAMFIAYFLKWLSKKDLTIISVVILLVLSLTCNSILKKSFENITGISLGKGTPMTSYLAMGTDINNDENDMLGGCGWWDGSTYYDLSDHNYDYDQTSEYLIQKLKTNVSNTIANPKKATTFYLKKISSMWNNPTFDFIYNVRCTFLESNDHLIDALLEADNNITKDIATSYCKAFMMIVYFFSLIFALRRLKQHPATILFLLYTLGGFFFHLFMEAKGQYIFNYFYFLIPLASYELNNLLNKER